MQGDDMPTAASSRCYMPASGVARIFSRRCVTPVIVLDLQKLPYFAVSELLHVLYSMIVIGVLHKLSVFSRPYLVRARLCFRLASVICDVMYCG